MKMKTVSILILLFTVLTASSQRISETELIGTWKVKNVTAISKMAEDKDAETQSMKNAFLKATFEFNADKKCSFLFDFNDMGILNGYWIFDSTKNIITIREQDNKNSENGILMEIRVTPEQPKIYFYIAETPLKLEMKKEEGS